MRNPHRRITNVRWSAAKICVATILVAAATALAAGEPKRSAADKPRVVKAESAYLRLIDQVDVPAQATGVLARIPIREGALVNEDELLVQMDNVDARLALDRARFDLDIARTLAASRAKVD